MMPLSQPGRWWRALAALCLLSLPPVRLCAGEVLDRILATVDHRTILASELDEAMRFECLLARRRPGVLTAGDRREGLERLIDQELIEREMERTSFVPATPDDVATHVQEIRTQVPAWKSDAGWMAALQTYGLSERDVAERVAVQLNMMRFLDLRFRSSIQIDHRAIESYYLEQFIPKLHRAGAAEVPLREVSGRIEELLVQQRMAELQQTWLQSLRAQAEVQVR